MSIFIARPVRPRNFVIKLHVSLSVPCKFDDFLCNQDVHARRMGCKRGLNSFDKSVTT